VCLTKKFNKKEYMKIYNNLETTKIRRKKIVEDFKEKYGINYYTLRGRNYRKNNPSYISNYQKKYRKTKFYKLYRSSYCKNRRLNDVNFAFLQNIRKRIWSVLKGYTKTDNTKNIIGCSLEELKQYISSKFVYGMNFDNYGKWHLDHIKPCASFDLSKPEEQQKCFHYTNLQPLWAKDNLTKGAKIN